MNTTTLGARRNGREHGQSLVEASFIFLMFVFLFIGVLDVGFYSYALISVQSAARVAAVYTSTNKFSAGDSVGACAVVLKELSALPNITGNAVTTCGALPLLVSAVGPTPDANIPTIYYSTVTVQYQTIFLIPIPGILTNQLTVTRIVQLAVLS